MRITFEVVQPGQLIQLQVPGDVLPGESPRHIDHGDAIIDQRCGDGDAAFFGSYVAQAGLPLRKQVAELLEIAVVVIDPVQKHISFRVVDCDPGIGAADIGDHAQPGVCHTGSIFMMLVEPERPITDPRVNKIESPFCR